MDIPQDETVEKTDYVFLQFLYGFLVLLGISILFSLVKAIYHFYKVRRESNTPAIDDTIDTVCPSISIETSVSDRQSEKTVEDSDRLGVQLDKLRRLLNRLNAMGTFSRDTIGDLSAQSAACANISKAASSDLSAFWSSIDYDDFEESTINDGKFGKTPTEKSLSPSISDFSLDTSGIPLDNGRYKNFATSSRENFLHVPSTSSHPANPSDTIVQILTILDSIMMKNINIDRRLKSNNNVLKTVELQNIKVSSEKEYSESSSPSLQKPNVCVSMNNMSNTNLSKSSSIITMEDSENIQSNITRATSMITSKHTSRNEFSHAIKSQCKMASTHSIEEKMSKVTSVVNFASSPDINTFYATNLPSPKSFGNKKFSISQSVSLCVEPFFRISTQPKGISKSLSTAPVCNLTDNIIDMTKTKIVENLPCTFEIDAIDRSHSLSDLLDKTLISIESNIEKAYSYEKDLTLHSLNPQSKSQILKSLSEYSTNFQKYPLHNGTSTIKNKNCHNKNHLSHEKLNSVSSKCLNSPKVVHLGTLKSSISVPEMKNSECLRLISPDISSSSSDAFLSPLVIDLSPSEKSDWKSPVEFNSEINVLRNLTPHNENVILSRKSFIFVTPPLPKETVSDEMII